MTKTAITEAIESLKGLDLEDLKRLETERLRDLMFWLEINLLAAKYEIAHRDSSESDIHWPDALERAA